jgi:hypothetical protein
MLKEMLPEYCNQFIKNCKFIKINRPMNLFHLGNWGTPKFHLYYRKQTNEGYVFSAIINLSEFESINGLDVDWYIEGIYWGEYKILLEELLENSKNILDYNK